MLVDPVSRYILRSADIATFLQVTLAKVNLPTAAGKEKNKLIESMTALQDEWPQLAFDVKKPTGSGGGRGISGGSGSAGKCRQE